MGEAAGEVPKASAITHFAFSFGALSGLVAIVLLVTGKWTSAVGVVIGLFPFLWGTRQIRIGFRRTQIPRARSAGARTMAVINGTAGAVILFAGALIGGDLILVVTAAFGIWMIGMAMLLYVAAGSGSRTDSGDKFVRET